MVWNWSETGPIPHGETAGHGALYCPSIEDWRWEVGFLQPPQEVEVLLGCLGQTGSVESPEEFHSHVHIWLLLEFRLILYHWTSQYISPAACWPFTGGVVKVCYIFFIFFFYTCSHKRHQSQIQNRRTHKVSKPMTGWDQNWNRCTLERTKLW